MQSNTTAPVEDAELERLMVKRLAEIRARTDAATPGTWVWETGVNSSGPDDGRYQHIFALQDGLCIAGIADTYHKPSMKIPWDGKLDYISPTHGLSENASFIAHAREDIPYLLGLIEWLAKDARRMNWLEEKGVESIYLRNAGQFNPASQSLRSAIDLAMREPRAGGVR